MSGCNSTNPATNARTPAGAAGVTHGEFGKLPNGTAIDQFVLTASNGAEVRVLNYGGIITAIKVPDHNGKMADVVLGYDNFAPYVKNPTYFGAIIGRYANRIAGGKFSLEDKTYTLALNNKPNTLHGGIKGFDKVVWQAEPFTTANAAGVELTYVSADGEEGYPGTMTVHVKYSFNNSNELAIDYSATSDKTTVVNFTNHSYFNLAGEGSGDVLAQRLTINADTYTVTDKTGIPTGDFASVAGTPLDFRTSTPIGSRIATDIPLLTDMMGYDHNFVINRAQKAPLNALVVAARVEDPGSGRVLEVRTTEPGIQLYTANQWDGSLTGKAGHSYNKRYAFCLETQHYPDSPNHPDFPTTVLKPGEQFHSRTVYDFGVN